MTYKLRIAVRFCMRASIYLVPRMMENKTGHTPCPLELELWGPPTRNTQRWHSSGPKVPSAVVEAVSKLCANTEESNPSMSQGQRNQCEVRTQHSNVHISQGPWVPFIHSEEYMTNSGSLCCFSATQSYQGSAHPSDLDTSYFALFWKQEREFSVRTNLLIWERSKEAHRIFSQSPPPARLSMGTCETLLFPLDEWKEIKSCLLSHCSPPNSKICSTQKSSFPFIQWPGYR